MALPASIVQLHTQQYKTFEKIFVYLNAAAGSSVWSSPGTFPEAKTFHYVIDHGFLVQDFAEELAFPFHPCKPFPLPPLPVVPLPFTISRMGFCPHSLQLPFLLVSLFLIFSHHLVWTILISPSSFPQFPLYSSQKWTLKSAASLVWPLIDTSDTSYSVYALFFFLLPTIFLHCPFYLAWYIHLARKRRS